MISAPQSLKRICMRILLKKVFYDEEIIVIEEYQSKSLSLAQVLSPHLYLEMQDNLLNCHLYISRLKHQHFMYWDHRRPCAKPIV